MTSTSDAAAFARIEATGRFSIDDIALLGSVFSKFGTASGTPWDAVKHAHLILPPWFRMGLDPSSDEYLQQQKQLWRIIVGVDRDYDPRLDEQTDDLPGDPVRMPAYFRGRGDQAVTTAANHIIATGMILLHSKVKAGCWALEYGAGFGQTALTLARMGVHVDTVDISDAFCGYIREQARFFGLDNLTSFNGEFGLNPRGDYKYDLIYFYESFHHCLDFRDVLGRIKTYLRPEGRVLLAGEPIVARENLAVPYPWGLRLHSECVAVMRVRRWCELGFTEAFIADMFTNNGFTTRKNPCDVSDYGTTWTSALRERRVSLGSQWLPERDAKTWHGAELNGRWSTARSSLALDCTESFSALQVCAANHHPVPQAVNVVYGGRSVGVTLHAHNTSTFWIDAQHKSPDIVFESQTHVPAEYSTGSKDGRHLGIFVQYIDYC